MFNDDSVQKLRITQPIYEIEIVLEFIFMHHSFTARGLPPLQMSFVPPVQFPVCHFNWLS